MAFLQCRQHLVLVPRGTVLADRQGSGGPVVLSLWPTCLLLHGGGELCSHTHGEKTLIATDYYMIHTQEMKQYVQTVDDEKDTCCQSTDLYLENEVEYLF